MRSMLLVCALVSTASAETLIVRPEGAMVQSKRPCGSYTRKQVENYIKAEPVLLIEKKGMSMGPRGDSLKPASKTVSDEKDKSVSYGFWNLNSKMDADPEEPVFSKTVIVTLSSFFNKDGSRDVKLSIVRRIDAIECYEQWQGTVVPK